MFLLSVSAGEEAQEAAGRIDEQEHGDTEGVSWLRKGACWVTEYFVKFCYTKQKANEY